MNVIYPKAREAFARGLVDWTSGDVKGLALVAGYTYSATDEFLAAIPGGARLFAYTLPSPTATNGDLAGGAYTEPLVAAGDTIVAIVHYLDTGVDATSRLLTYMDENGDGTPMAWLTKGGNITIDWPTGRIATL